LTQNTWLGLSQGANLSFDATIASYTTLPCPEHPSPCNYPATPRGSVYRAMIEARNTSNVGIVGHSPGTSVINARGAHWFEKEAALTSDLGDLIRFVEVRGAVLRGVQLQDPPNTAAHMEYCQDIVVDSVEVIGNSTRSNVQGVIFDSTQRARLTSSRFALGGVAFRVQSGAGAEGSAVSVPSEDVVFENCTALGGEGAEMQSSCAAVTGTLSSGASSLTVGSQPQGSPWALPESMRRLQGQVESSATSCGNTFAAIN